jgi:TPP-dependent 2-oxoacid decarboxylase
LETRTQLCDFCSRTLHIFQLQQLLNLVQFVNVLSKFFTRLPVRTRMVTQETWMAIGWALAALLGAQLADRSHRHILVMGDGAFHETAQELSTILRHGLAPIILVCNNSRYEVENWNHAGRASEAAWRADPIDIGYNVLQSWSYH